MKLYVVIDEGCFECGVSSNLVGVFKDEKKAQQIAKARPTWRDGGQSCGTWYEIETEKAE